jgi:hypothetical protein
VKPALVVLLLSTAAWLLVGLVSFAHTLWFGFGDPHLAARLSLIEWGPWIILSPLVIVFATIVPITGLNWKRSLPLHALASVGVALAINGMTFAGRGAAGPRITFNRPSPRETAEGPTFVAGPEGARLRVNRGGALSFGVGGPPGRLPPPGRAPLSSVLLFNARLTLPIYWLIVVGVLAWRHHRIALEREGRAVRAEREAVRARLSALQAQLQPHFLFNSLNAIAAFIKRRPEAAEDMVCALSNLLRSILHMSERPEIALREEVGFAREFLAVHSIRFEDTLRICWSIEPRANEAVVPTLLLQPIIENALEHGLRGAAGEIAIGAEVRGPRLVLTVTDRADLPATENGHPHAGTRLGLRNTRERLETLFATDYRLDLIDLPEGVRAEIELPFRTASA